MHPNSVTARGISRAHSPLLEHRLECQSSPTLGSLLLARLDPSPGPAVCACVYTGITAVVEREWGTTGPGLHTPGALATAQDPALAADEAKRLGGAGLGPSLTRVKV